MYHLVRQRLVILLTLLCVSAAKTSVGIDFSKITQTRGIICGVGLNEKEIHSLISETEDREWTVFVQTDQPELLRYSKELALEKKLLGRRFFGALGRESRIQLANNVADWIIVGSAMNMSMTNEQILRPLRPGGSAQVKGSLLSKPTPDGVDDWSHPYHGPDNNPQSNDQLVKGSFRTQFIGNPMFSPMPEQTVIANGRIYKAMGHLAHKENQNEMLNTLLCINAYNGTILWKRALPEGFMLHRNTMIATDNGLLMGDNKSCKLIDGETGNITKEFFVSIDLSDGPVWKWMALSDGILYALVGNKETEVETQRSARRGLGHWPWDMWQGHEYDQPETAFGYGRTLVAIDISDGETVWTHQTNDFIDARAVCMNEKEIYCYSPDQCLTALSRETGIVTWRNESKALLDAIGANQKAQHYITGYATTCYMKCDAKHLFFAGPQRQQTVVASASDGKLEWTYPEGNLQLVLRDDGVWAAGPQKSENGVKLNYQDGKVLATFPARRACTRATGCLDSIFFRANGGTVRVLTEDSKAQHFDPMRPPCQDGVLIAGGHLYWGPWMCGCQLSLYGNIGLRPENQAYVSAVSAIASTTENSNNSLSLKPKKGDWSTYRGTNSQSDRSLVPIASNVEVAWTQQICDDVLPTAATTADGKVFVSDRRGMIQAYDRSGKRIWKQFTDGAIYYPPTIADGRLFVGSADGKVYAFSAATGSPLWSFRVGPNLDRIPVFDSLLTAWPISGGVIYQDGTVYAAAGLTHYDGTHVVALNATNGTLIAENRTSGTLQDEVNNGISVQGELTIVDGELRFLAGGVYETARYELDTLKCLNSPQKQVDSQFRTAFYPYYPTYGKYISLDYSCKDGCELSHDASYEGSQFVNLAKYPKRSSDIPKVQKEAARWVRRGGKMPQPLWQDQSNRRFTCFAATESTLLAGGHLDNQDDSAFLAAIDNESGKDLWFAPLSAPPVKGGATLGHDGRIYVVLENGQLICLDPVKNQNR